MSELAPESTVPLEDLLELVEVQAFLAREAALLDAWELDEWLTLFEPGATYEVPATDNPGALPIGDLFLIDDPYDQIKARVKRLKSKHAHAENPRSRTRHLVTNVRIVDHPQPGLLEVEAGFLVFRLKGKRVAEYVGTYRHVLVRDGATFLFRRRRAELDLEVLSQEGRISFIL